MGGPGSGYWYRWNSKATVESQYKIDIRWMKKQGYLHPGAVGTLSWGIPGNEAGSIGFLVDAEWLLLIYSNRQSGGEWEQIKDEIFFCWTPCNYGGNRQWFLCPGCNRRVAVVYGGKYFRCRHCHNLTYASQQESKSDRLMRKARKIRARLGASNDLTESILFKPQNMHQKTFDRLRREAEDASNLAWRIMLQRCQKQKDGIIRW
jgi:hypothetical protein